MTVTAPQPRTRRKPTHVDHLECVICFRSLAGLPVRIATGICTSCEPVTTPHQPPTRTKKAQP